MHDTLTAMIDDQTKAFWQRHAEFSHWAANNNQYGMLDQFERMRFWYQGTKETEKKMQPTLL